MEKRIIPEELALQRQTSPQLLFMIKDFEVLKAEFAKTQKIIMQREQEIHVLRQEITEGFTDILKERDKELTKTMGMMLAQHIHNSRPWWKKIFKK